jgi:hypothetical protein
MLRGGEGEGEWMSGRDGGGACVSWSSKGVEERGERGGCGGEEKEKCAVDW